MKTKYIILFLLTLGFGAESSGQSWFSKFYNGWLTKPRNVDSSYIYQQSMGFSPSLTSNFSRQRVQMTTVYFIEEMPVMDENYNLVLDENGNAQFVDFLLSAVDKMEEGVSSRVGAILGLGRLGAGWSFEVAPDSSQKSSTFMFSFRGNKFGLNINYLGFSQKVIERINWEPDIFLGEGFLQGNSDTIATDNRVRRLTVDAYYVINTRRFAYPPGIAGNMVQLRSAGSWMLAGRYIQSDLSFNPDYAVGRFGMAQFSLGCGYSYTWVPWSRRPRENGKGMYTFFLNGTIIPMLTVFNYLSTEPYLELDESISGDKYGYFCWPTPNIMANATMGFSWSKFYLGAQFNYNVFHFNTRNAITGGGLFHEKGLEVMGVLYEWNLMLKFQACF